MQTPSASGVRVWRRDASPTSAALSSSTTKSLHMRKSHAAVTLLPLTPVHAIVPGAIDVDDAKTRVVYLAPLTSTAAEKYFARTKRTASPGGGDSSDEDDANDADLGAYDDRLTNDEQLAAGIRRDTTRNQYSRGSLVNPLLAQLLADHDRRMARRRAKQAKLCGAARSSLFDQRSSLDGMLAETRRETLSPVKTKPRADRPEDEQIERLKQYVHSMPVTNEDVETFKQTMKTYQRLQMEYRSSLMWNHSSPMGFNMEAAWNKRLLEDRHRLWVQAHDERFAATRARKVVEDEKHERRIQETTTEHRTQMRLLREVRLRLVLESQMILPTIMLAAATHTWLERLQRHWRQEQLSKRLRGMIRFWCQQRKSRSGHQHAAHLLIHWLQKSVAVKSVAFRVFRGIRNYVRRVKKIQRLWKIKQAKRLRNYLLLQRLWVEQETILVDQANEQFEKKLAKKLAQGDTKPAARIKTKSTAKTAATQRGVAGWLTFVTSDIRMQVIKEFVREQEIEYTRLFRHQEDDLYPQLVQTLRDENPNKARSYIKAVANNHALLGRVHIVLSHFAGAVNDVPPVKPFDFRSAPVRDLIMTARERSPPDETGARFGT